MRAPTCPASATGHPQRSLPARRSHWPHPAGRGSARPPRRLLTASPATAARRPRPRSRSRTSRRRCPPAELPRRPRHGLRCAAAMPCRPAPFGRNHSVVWWRPVWGGRGAALAPIQPWSTTASSDAHAARVRIFNCKSQFCLLHQARPALGRFITACCRMALSHCLNCDIALS